MLFLVFVVFYCCFGVVCLWGFTLFMGVSDEDFVMEIWSFCIIRCIYFCVFGNCDLVFFYEYYFVLICLVEL